MATGESSRSELHSRKRDLRREIRRKLRLLTPAVKAAAAADLCARLQRHPRIGDAAFVAAFMALPNEPDLSAYLRARLERKQPVLLPRIVGDPADGIMELCVVRSWAEDFKPGALGILEPGDHCEMYAATRTDGANQAAVQPIDAVLVPGLAFDRDGNRMGKGAGHYDRLLAQVPVRFKAGIGFLCQRVEQVPVEAHDVRLDEILLG